MEQVLRVERLQQAILENLQPNFAKPMLPSLYPGYPTGPYGAGPVPYGAGPPMSQIYRGGRGGLMGQIAQQPGPKAPGRGRGILGNFGNNPFLLLIHSTHYSGLV